MATIRYDYIYSLAQEYQKGFIGDAWEKLFDHMNKVEYANVYSSRREEFYGLFSNYLGSFGMFRRSLKHVHVPQLLNKGEKTFLAYLMKPNDDTQVAAWIRCHDLLAELKCSCTHTAITKILMGLGGRIPAYDSRFVRVMSNQPLFMIRGVSSLVDGLRNLGKPQLITQNGRYPIPWERILDMALWQASPEAKELMVSK